MSLCTGRGEQQTLCPLASFLLQQQQSEQSVPLSVLCRTAFLLSCLHRGHRSPSWSGSLWAGAWEARPRAELSGSQRASRGGSDKLLRATLHTVLTLLSPGVQAPSSPRVHPHPPHRLRRQTLQTARHALPVRLVHGEPWEPQGARRGRGQVPSPGFPPSSTPSHHHHVVPWLLLPSHQRPPPAHPLLKSDRIQFIYHTRHHSQVHHSVVYSSDYTMINTNSRTFLITPKRPLGPISSHCPFLVPPPWAATRVRMCLTWTLRDTASTAGSLCGSSLGVTSSVRHSRGLSVWSDARAPLSALLRTRQASRNFDPCCCRPVQGPHSPWVPMRSRPCH